MAIRWIQLVSYVVFISLFGLYSCSDPKPGNGETPDDINGKLVKIENDIYIAINEGNKKKALDLVGQLNHPSSEVWDSKSDFFKSYTYNEWWNVRRESIRKEIFDMKEVTKDKKLAQEQTEVNQHPISSEQSPSNSPGTQEAVNLTNVTLNERYLGLYAHESADGNQIFKFSKNNSTNELNIIHQDNISGQVKIENYIFKSFNEEKGQLDLENKKSQENITIFFKSEPQSTNGFKLLDNHGNFYEFVSK